MRESDEVEVNAAAATATGGGEMRSVGVRVRENHRYSPQEASSQDFGLK